MKKLIFVAVLFLIALSSCEKKTYRYSEKVKTFDLNGRYTGNDIKNEKTIEAKTDSEAYRLAYGYFCISVFNTDKISRENNVLLDKTVDFVLENEDGINIRYNPNMQDQEKVEAEVEAEVSKLVYE